VLLALALLPSLVCGTPCWLLALIAATSGEALHPGPVGNTFLDTFLVDQFSLPSDDTPWDDVDIVGDEIYGGPGISRESFAAAPAFVAGEILEMSAAVRPLPSCPTLDLPVAQGGLWPDDGAVFGTPALAGPGSGWAEAEVIGAVLRGAPRGPVDLTGATFVPGAAAHGDDLSWDLHGLPLTDSQVLGCSQDLTAVDAGAVASGVLPLDDAVPGASAVLSVPLLPPAPTSLDEFLLPDARLPLSVHHGPLQPPRLQTLLAPPPPFVAAKKFIGPRQGTCFKMGAHGLGYYADDGGAGPVEVRGTAGKVEISLDLLVPEAPPCCVPTPVPELPRPVPPVSRTRVPRSRVARLAGDPHAHSWPSVVPLDDKEYARFGLWAVASANFTAWNSGDHFLRTVAADALLVQEHHLTSVDACTSAENAVAYRRWRLSLQPALPTAAGGSSAGVGVGVARHTGLARSVESPLPEDTEHRFVMRHWQGLGRGGAHLASIYPYDGEGLSARNLDLLQTAAYMLSRVKGLWICAGDLNMPPDLLVKSGWLQLIDGVLCFPESPTCGDMVLDYFIVPRRFVHRVVVVQCLSDAGLSPHLPVRMLIRGDCRCDLVRQLRAPSKIPAFLPNSCLSRSSSALQPACFTDIDSQYEAAYDLAEEVACEILGVDGAERTAYTGRARGTKYVMAPLDLPRTDVCEKVSPLGLAWRAGAAALRRLQAHVGRVAWCHQVLLTLGSMDRAVQRVAHDDRRAEWHTWCQQVRRAVVEPVDRIKLGQLGAVSASCAKKVAQQDARVSRAAFCTWIHEGPAAGLGRQHRFTRTSVGWTPSSLLPCASPVDGSDSLLDGPDDERQMDPHDGERLLQSEPAAPDDIDDLQDDPPCAPEVMGDIHALDGGFGGRPASIQEEAELEATRWGEQWLCGHDYQLPWPDEVAAALPALDLDKLTGAILSFPAKTGLGWDKMHPRAWLRLGPAALASLLHLLTLVELLGRWPAQVGHVMVVLLAKAAGGFRPIGLFPSVIRVWMRVRLADAVIWQSLHERPWLYASAGKGADVAAWRQAARSEQAAARGWHYGAALLDMVKAFERVPHDILVCKAVAKGYSLRLLKVSLGAYRLARTLMVQGACSRLMVAVRGITAGAGHAVVELRLLLCDLWDDAHRLYPSINLTVFVDDSTLEARGTRRFIIRLMPRVIKLIVHGLTSLRMELGAPKCFVLASSLSFAKELAGACADVLTMTPTPRARSLGVGLAGGVATATHVLKRRLADVCARLGSFAAARRLAVDTARLLRSGGIAGFTYGQASVGVPPALLQAQRVAAAKALGDRTAGGDLGLSLAVADGARGGMADPAFQAHLQPICAWARAAWESWMPRDEMMLLAHWAKQKLLSTDHQWRLVCGPATATAASLGRLGWHLRDAFTMVTHRGVELHLCRDPPALVASLVKAAVIDWRWARVVSKEPSLASPVGCPPFGPCWRPIARLLDPAVRSKGWNAHLRGALRSAVTNRQWPQERKHRAGLVEEPGCRLCHAVGANVLHPDPVPAGTALHRSVFCPCHRGQRARTAPREVLDCCRDPSRATGRTTWLTRALQPSLAHTIPPPASVASFTWIVRPVDELLSVEWTVYTDGSLLDGPFAELRRPGWAFVALDRDGVVQAIARGVPPPWISTIFGAEAWAVLQAVLVAPVIGTLRIDCKAAVNLLQAGPAAAVKPTRVTAAVWAGIFAALDERPPADLSWMPAHTAVADVGRRCIGDGSLLSARDRRGNEIADFHAKEAVAEHRVPTPVRQAILDQERQVASMARWVAQVTVDANAWGPNRLRDSENAARRFGPVIPRRLRRTTRRDEIPPALGGHVLAPTVGATSRRWECSVCRRAAVHRPTLAVTRCRGSAVRRWEAQAADLAQLRGNPGAEHELLLTGAVVWCFKCGANACSRAVALSRPCPGRTEGFHVQAKQRLLLGLHPATRAPLRADTVPQPGGQLPRTFRAAVARARSSKVRAASPTGVSRCLTGGGSHAVLPTYPARQVPGPASSCNPTPPEPAWRAAMRARIAARHAHAQLHLPAPKRRRLTGKQPDPGLAGGRPHFEPPP